MIKRIAAGVFTAGIVFGTVTGLAAGLDVSSHSLGSGDATVSSCDTDGVNSDYTFTSGTNLVSAVVVNGIADAACDGATVLVQLLDSEGAVLSGGHGTATNQADEDIDDNAASVTLTTAQAADTITGVRVTIKK